MKYLTKRVTKILFGVLLVGLATTVQAQDKQAAFKSFNKALQLANDGQYEQAVTMFNQAITEGEKIGEDGKDVVSRAKKQLPIVYYQLSLSKYKKFQKDKSLASLEETISSFHDTGDIAKEYGNNEITDKSSSVITQLLYTKSILQFRTQDYSGAMASLDQAIERNPNYAKAYYQKGLVLKKQDGNELDQIISFFDKAIQVGQQNNDNQIVRKAKDAARDELVYRGSKLVEDKKYDSGIKVLKKSLNYDSTSADAYYRISEAYNKQAEWDLALSNAKKALENEKGGKTDKAKIYFELGTAYKNKAQKAEACDAFGNAAFGSFKAPAEHQMEFELKCKETTN